MPMTPEEKWAYMKQWRQKNKEKILASKKKWYEKNKQKEAARHKKYREEHPEEWHRMYTIGKWKQKGVKSDDYDALYDQYMAETHCADCDKEFQGKIGDGLGAYRCLDHDHITHAFRAVVCTGCNQRRGVVDKKLSTVKTLEPQEGEKEAGHEAPVE